jgi:hypothetical protein
VVELDKEPELMLDAPDFTKRYPVIAGSKNYPTPAGDYLIRKIEEKPKWIPPVKTDKHGIPIRGDDGHFAWRGWVASDKELLRYLKHEAPTDSRTGLKYVPYGNEHHPLGPVKIRMYSMGGYALPRSLHGHGDESIEDAMNRGGWYRSHSCIRMRDNDVIELAREIKPELSMRDIPLRISRMG